MDTNSGWTYDCLVEDKFLFYLRTMHCCSTHMSNHEPTSIWKKVYRSFMMCITARILLKGLSFWETAGQAPPPPQSGPLVHFKFITTWQIAFMLGHTSYKWVLCPLHLYGRHFRWHHKCHQGSRWKYTMIPDHFFNWYRYVLNGEKIRDKYVTVPKRTCRSVLLFENTVFIYSTNQWDMIHGDI